MPEYLAPGVYVEEVDTGSKPIEGVSTSTAGMVGVTERGPVNVPVLVTSVGEFRRWYGGQLRSADYPGHNYFPHAVEGFFGNGGKRVYVVRALDDGAATRAFAPLFDRGGIASHATRLVRSAGEGTGTAASPPGVVMLEVGALAATDWVRVGDGSDAEYRQFVSSAADSTMVVVQLPLSQGLPAGATADQLVRATVANTTLVGDGDRGDTTIVVDGVHADITALAASALAGTPCVELGGAIVGEYRLIVEATQQTVVSATNSTLRLTLDAGLQQAHADGAAVAEIDLTGAAVGSAAIDAGVAGDALLYVDDRLGNLDTRADLVHIHDGGATLEVKRIGELDEFDFVPGAYSDLAVGTLVEAVEFAPDRTVAAGAVAPFGTFDLSSGEGLVAGQRIVIDPAGANETVTIQSIAGDTVTVTPNPAADPSGLDVVPAAKTLTAPVRAGGAVLALDDRMGISEDTVLQVGSGIGAEFVTVVSLPATSLTAPNSGNVVVTPALSAAVAAGALVQIVEFQGIAGRQSCVVAIAASAGDQEAFVSDGDSYAATEILRLTTGTGQTSYHVLTGSSGPAAPQMVQLGMALSRSHPAGSPVVQRDPLFDIQALDAGIWGNRLRLSVQDETQGLVGSTTLATVVNATTIRLASASGVQAGTLLEFYNTATGATVGDPVKVSNINRASNNTITIQGAGLSAAQSVPGLGVRSREFRLSVLLLRQPDPTTPTRDDQIIDREEYRNLSMDPRHANYIEKAIGDIDGALRPWDRRPEGASLYVRVRDLAPDQATEESLRLGPEALRDTLRSGRVVPAKHRLDQVAGSDSIGSLADAHYVGLDNADPDLRTGLQSLLNVEDVSIVAVPAQTSATVQQAVIDHCEAMRYRFAVLDSRREPQDTLTDVQDQRQQFDTKYAALYYPWLSIPDPYPASLANVQDVAIPPSGHMIGVYARTDVERGVHKAPANEVVRGIVGLRRNVNKEQQDILNPFPVNINVIRDFRNNNRGIRVYGARCITSDSDWKYVNVRRLTIFIEHSIERGLQWVVFEPNAEALWARVTRSVKNFLTTVWRNGALEGAKVEEAFFVKCDRTTMTQTDIDSGRLIVLIGIAPVKPAEFVIVRIGLWTARSDD